jgi:hypothetical protein
MKKFIYPEMNISKFDAENVVTTASTNGTETETKDAVKAAEDWLNTSKGAQVIVTF